MGVLAMQVVRSAGSSCYGALLLVAALAALAGALASAPAQAERIENATATFAALDKVSAKKEELPIKLNQTETFRTLKITPRICLTSDPSEPPRTSSFVEVDEIQFDGSKKRIFSGWMFAESPGLNPLVHPVFDIWLTGCSQPKTTTASSKVPSPDSAETPPQKAPPKRRVPR
jgi:hypothetical protein